MKKVAFLAITLVAFIAIGVGLFAYIDGGRGTPTFGPEPEVSTVDAAESIDQLRADAQIAEARVFELRRQIQEAKKLLENLSMREVKEELQAKILQLEEDLDAAKLTKATANVNLWIAEDRQKVDELFSPNSEPPQ